MKITDALLKQIYRQAQLAYPRQCAGFLLGVVEGGGFAHRIIPVATPAADWNDRFEIDPEEFIRVADTAEDYGLELMGLYHSHPDWPAIPSQADVSAEVERLYCLIVSVFQKYPLSTTVWQLATDDPRRFVALPLEIVDEREAAGG